MKRLITVLLLVGCGEETGNLVRIREQEDRLTQRPLAQLDVLWVIDNSATMEAEQQKIVEQASLFFARILPRSVDYHLGVVTTDPADAGRLRRYRGPAVPGCDGCAFVSRAVPCADPAASDPQSGCPALAVFRDLALTGVDGTASERAFQNAAAALGLDVEDSGTGLPVVDPTTGRVFSAPPPENAGFLREDADLLLIFVSDEDEGLKTVGAPVRYYERLFSLLKANTERRVMVSTFVGWPYGEQGAPAELPTVDGICQTIAPLLDGDPKNDGDLARTLDAQIKVSNGCLDLRAPNAENAYAEVGRRYVELACRMGGVIGNLCAADYLAPFERLTETALSLGRSFVLRYATDLDRGPDCDLFSGDDPRLDCDRNGSSEDNVDGPLCVTAAPEGGAPSLIPRDPLQGWSWDEASRSVVFLGDLVPGPGSEVLIRYKVAPQLGACR